MTRAYLVGGLAFGDEGKGSVVDSLTRQTGAQLVVRYSGGPQACHTVVTPTGMTHQFHQLGSGSLVSGTGTYLSRFMLIEPLSLLEELKSIQYALPPKPYVEKSCPIITPFHWILNQARETSRGDKKHGSCGWGVGELRTDQIYGARVVTVRDLLSGERVVQKLLDEIAAHKVTTIRSLMIDTNADLGEFEAKVLDVDTAWLADFYVGRFLSRVAVVEDNHLATLINNSPKAPVIFEGAQGVLLDEKHGFWPNNSWTDCTFGNCSPLLRGVENLDIHRIGVLRTYFTRHGAGPFVTESELVGSDSDHNKTGKWNGAMRYGWFDLPAAQYAVNAIHGIDGLALTHLDQCFGEIPTIAEYKNSRGYPELIVPLAEDWSKFQPGEVSLLAPHEIAGRLGTKICCESRGQTANDKKWSL